MYYLYKNRPFVAIFRIWVYFGVLMVKYISRNYKLSTKHKGLCYIVSGPRQSGKSLLLKNEFSYDLYFDLSDFDTFRKLSFQSDFLERIILPEIKTVAIDNIHLLPNLFTQIDEILQSRPILFVTTTISVYQISKHIPDNLTPFVEIKSLKPLTYIELSQNKLFSLNRVLQFGSLPAIYDSTTAEVSLMEYVGSLLLNDFNTTGKVKKIENFSRFLNHVGVLNGFEINFENIGLNCNIPGRTVREYFKLLENYELGYLIESVKLNKSSSVQNKFYFFDIGITHAFKNDFAILDNFENFDRSLKHFVLLELLAFKNVFYPGLRVNFWSDYRKNSFDFVINSEIAIVVNSTKSIHTYHLKKIAKKLSISGLKKCYFVALDETQNLVKNSDSESIQYFHILKFLDLLWSQSLLK